MSFKENNEQIKKWFIEKYQVGSTFIDEITKHVNDVFQQLTPNPNFKDGDQKQLGLYIKKRKETDYLEIKMDVETMLFLGGMSMAISKLIITEILPAMTPETKKCEKCNSNNNGIVSYCFHCGEKFKK